VLPALTLTADFPELRRLARTTLAFRPPPDYGSGGWGFRIPRGEQHRVQGCSSTSYGTSVRARDWATTSTRGQRRQSHAGTVGWTTRAEQDRKRRRWLPSNEVTGDGLASRPGRTRRPPRNWHGDYCGRCRPCRRTPTSRSASSASRSVARAGRALLLPHTGAGTSSHLPRVGRPTATWRRGGGGSDVTDERRPRPNPPPGQRRDSNEEFRRALERETDLSLREDPDRRRLYTSMDLPHSRSPSDDRSLPTRRHHRHDELTLNGETLTLVGWSQRTGMGVEVLLRRCRRGWSVEQVLTTPLGEDRPRPHSN
jgi:hypothetical protein